MKKIIFFFMLMLSVMYSQAQWMIVQGDSTTFPTDSSFAKIDTTTGNIWQIGVPQKTFFGTANSAPFAIMTDTINFYPINNFSTFTVEFTDTSMFGWIPDAYIGFWHKYEMDSLKDGGYVEISLDSGATWTNVENSWSAGISNVYETNFYSPFSNDTIQGNIPAFTGTQSNWQYSAIKLQWMFAVIQPFPTGNNRNLYNSPKVMFRFVFKSDGIQTNKAGWIIDDIAIRIYDIGSGMSESKKSTFDVKIFPHPVSEQSIIQVVSEKNENDFKVEIYNSIGQIVKKSSLDVNNQYIIKANELTSGIYFYSVKNKSGENQNGKIIIK